VKPVQHSDATVLSSVSEKNTGLNDPLSSESEKNTGPTDPLLSEPTDPLSAGSHLTSASSVAHDARSAANDTDSSSVAESSCTMLSCSDVLRYPSVDESANMDEHIVDFLLSLFWVLESKRLDRSCEHVDNLTLLTAPFEHRKNSSITDTDGRLLNFYMRLIYLLRMWSSCKVSSESLQVQC